MHILFITHYFPPEVNAPATRVHGMAKRWVAAGHKVSVCTGFPNHPQGRIYEGYKNALVKREVRDGIHVVRTFVYATPNKGRFKRSLSYIVFSLSAIFGSFFVKKPDVVVATSPQFLMLFSGFMVGLLKRKPFFVEVRDLWPESVAAVGAIQNNMMLRFLERLADFFYSKAKRVVVVSRSFKKILQRRGIDKEKIFYLPNGVNSPPHPPCEKDQGLLARLDLKGKFVISYIGTLGMAHGLEVVLDAAKELAHDDRFVFLLVGDGAEREALELSLQNKPVPNVRLISQQPKEKIGLFYSVTDVSLVLLRDRKIFQTVLPSKLLECMNYGKPIISNVRGESGRILKKAKGGVLIPPGDSQALRDAITAFFKDENYRNSMGKNGREYVRRNFDLDRLAQDYLDIMKG